MLETSFKLKGLSAGAEITARGNECWSFLGATFGVLIWPKVLRTSDWVSRCEQVTKCDAKEVTLIFSSRRQRIRRWPQGDQVALRVLTGQRLPGGGGQKGKVIEPAMQKQPEMYRMEETQLTFPPRKTWYQTEVPPKSMWKSVKQPFTLIRQYLQHRSRGAGK